VASRTEKAPRSRDHRIRPNVEAVEGRVLLSQGLVDVEKPGPALMIDPLRLSSVEVPFRGTVSARFNRATGRVFRTIAGTISRPGAGKTTPQYTPGPLVQVSGTSPFASSTADNVAGQTGTNFLHSEVEPRVAVDPTNPDHLVGVWQQDRWSNGGARGIVAGVSFDGGVSWQKVIIPNISLASGGNATNGGDYQRVGDPWVSFAPDGRTVYVSSVPFSDVDPTGAAGRSAVMVSKSTDGGRTWEPPVTLDPQTSPRVETDKDSITADPGRPRFAYAAWERLTIPPTLLGFRGPAVFSRTTNGGRTWQPARIIYDPGPNALTINHQIFVRPDGALIDAFTEFRAVEVPPFASTLSLLRSPDQGLTWPRPPLRGPKLLGRPVKDPDTGQPILTASTPFGFPVVFADVAMDARSGTLYAVWQDARFSGLRYDDIAFAMSTNGGRTWSTPIRINKTPLNIPPGNRQAFNPTIQVAADGTLGVSYYDFRFNDPNPGTLPTDAWIVFCRPVTPQASTNPAHWGGEVRLTDVSFDIKRAPLTTGGLTGGGSFLGEYEGLGASRNMFLAFFSQTHDSDPASIFSRRVGP
jgi:hypothetical protein